MKRQAFFDRAAVASGLSAGLGAHAHLHEPLLLFLAELHKWNQAYNLTAVRDPLQMLPRHIFDSLAAAPFAQGQRIADVGTGAGLPGIPLALAHPDKQFTLVDSNGKKTRFVRHAVAHLALHNVEVVQARVEEFAPAAGFDTVFCRAFTSLADFVAGCAELTAPGGQLVAMKGRYPADEIAALAGSGWAVAHESRVAVRDLEGERHILVLQQH